MTNRKTPQQIKEEILSSLRKGPLSTNKLSEELGSNWSTINSYVDELKNDGKIRELFSRENLRILIRMDDLAFYGLPFSEEIRRDSSSLLFTIANKWKEENGTNPSKTMLQKIAVELIEKTDKQLSKIPILRFHYGQTLAVSYDESFSKDYGLLKLTPGQESLLLSLIKKYKDMPSSKAQLEQYKKENMKFYFEKEFGLIKAFSAKNHEEIAKSLLKLSVYYPNELEGIFSHFEKFIYCSTILLNQKDIKESTETVNRIKEVFYLLWDFITTNCFFYDSEEFNKDKIELFNQIKTNVLNLKLINLNSVLDDLESEVNSISPEQLKEPISEESREFLHELLED